MVGINQPKGGTEMKQENFTRKEVIELVDQILQNPDELIDAVGNENTDLNAELLIEIAEDQMCI